MKSKVVRLSEDLYRHIADQGQYGETFSQILERVLGLSGPEKPEKRGKKDLKSNKKDR